MKKLLLVLTMASPFGIFAQRVASPDIDVYQNGAPMPFKNVALTDLNSDSANVSVGSNFNFLQNKRQTIPYYNFVKIGSTYYDLQTNASMGRRIVLHPDGKVSAVWTTANDQSFANRGTGYNHYNGTAWSNVSFPTNRIENVRLGWPSIGVNNGQEWVIGHNATTGGFVLSKNASIGSSNWTIGNLTLNQNGLRPIWGRVMNNGNIFHVISNYSDSSQPGDPRAPTIAGVRAPMTYSRSLDGGATWVDFHILLPGYDSNRVTSGGGDQYAIDVRDSIVAIVVGDQLEDVKLWKSTDNGATFTLTIMDSFKYAPYNSKTLMLDTPFVCDGSIDVAIDKNGLVHAFWGTTRVFDDDITNETYSFFPGTGLLAYWNEISMEKVFIAGASQFDRNRNGQYQINQGNTAALNNGAIPQGVLSVARLGNTSILRTPSAAISDDGQIFVTFSLPVEEDIDGNNLNYRDIMLVHSPNGGLNWANPVDVSQIEGKEEDFACIARQVNGFVHMIFQVDDIPGTNLQNNSANANNHPVGENEIMYAAIPVDKILDGSIGNLWPVGVQNFNANREVLIVSQNYPNPFNNFTSVIIWLDAPSDLSVEIMTLDGKVVKTINYNEKNAGNHQIEIDGSDLSAGVYFYTIKTQTHSVTNKMIVE